MGEAAYWMWRRLRRSADSEPGHVEQHREHRRHEHGVGDRLALDRQRGRRPRRTAAARRGGRPPTSRRTRWRSRRRGTSGRSAATRVRRAVPGGDQVVLGIGEQVPVAEHHALGPPGGAARVGDRGERGRRRRPGASAGAPEASASQSASREHACTPSRRATSSRSASATSMSTPASFTMYASSSSERRKLRSMRTRPKAGTASHASRWASELAPEVPDRARRARPALRRSHRRGVRARHTSAIARRPPQRLVPEQRRGAGERPAEVARGHRRRRSRRAAFSLSTSGRTSSRIGSLSKSASQRSGVISG